MWRAQAGYGKGAQVVPAGGDDDDWETDPDFVNDVTEQEQRWGAKTIEGSGKQEAFSMDQLRKNVVTDDKQRKHGMSVAWKSFHLVCTD
jgi:cortactin